MTRILLIIVAVLALCATPAFADKDITFAWDPNSEPDLDGYRLYMTDTVGQYTYGPDAAIATTDQTTVTVRVPDGSWYFVVTAFDTSERESGPSNEVTSDGPSAPGVLKITAQVHVQVSVEVPQ